MAKLSLSAVGWVRDSCSITPAVLLQFMTDMSHRHMEPELLDGLAADDPLAIASRRDLRRINALMFQARIMASLLKANVPTPPKRILEIGAGDGRFMLKVARLMATQWQNVEMMMVDRVSLIDRDTRTAFAKLGWEAHPIVADVFDQQALQGSFDLVCANLILHHFDDVLLVDLFDRIMTIAPRLVATEPLRAKGPLFATRLLRLIGAGAVTLNDATQSVRSGFVGTELSYLWRLSGGIPATEGRRGLFTQGFVGTRPPGSA